MAVTATDERVTYDVRLRRPHAAQQEFIESPSKRKIIRAGRRGGKTTGVAVLAVQRFLDGGRVLYAAPTGDQIIRFWAEVKRALSEPIDGGVFVKNETLHTIEREGTEQRLRAKTAWNADTLRGDYADLLILDEWQLMDEEAWETVGAPMLLDNNGDAVFVYTPPSLRSRSTTKARDPKHAAKMYKAALQDISGRWGAFHFRSADNPHISAEALAELVGDMTELAYRQEILAEDLDVIPGALWRSEMFQIAKTLPDMARVVVAIDPAATSKRTSDDTGITVAGLGVDGNGYVLADRTCRLGPDGWARRSLAAFDEFSADRIVAEINNGGEMVENTLRTIRRNFPYKALHASRGKAIRAEPIAALYEQRKIFHVEGLAELEDELTSWTPDSGWSPGRLDSDVWALTELMVGTLNRVEFY